MGCAQLGQLLVWEWRSETYVVKQQGHYFDVASTAFSPDGACLVTGADDSKVRCARWAGLLVASVCVLLLPLLPQRGCCGGSQGSCVRYRYNCAQPARSQVKVWTLSNGFCFVTFSEHTAPITAVQFVSRWAS